MAKVPHAITRAAERYGINLTPACLTALTEQCKAGRGRLSFLPNGRERHLVLHNNVAMVAIYLPHGGSVPEKSGRIITILPPDAAKPGSKGSPATKIVKGRLRPLGKSALRSRKNRRYT